MAWIPGGRITAATAAATRDAVPSPPPPQTQRDIVGDGSDQSDETRDGTECGRRQQRPRDARAIVHEGDECVENGEGRRGRGCDWATKSAVYKK